jgi:four helix bundle protein
MPPRDLILRTRDFALEVLTFCRALPPTDEALEAARQLRRAATGLRSNYRAARKGRSPDEFAATLGIAAEEADECVGWLEYFRDGRIREHPALLQESIELSKIMATAYRTAKRNNARRKKLPNS